MTYILQKSGWGWRYEPSVPVVAGAAVWNILLYMDFSTAWNFLTALHCTYVSDCVCECTCVCACV